MTYFLTGLALFFGARLIDGLVFLSGPGDRMQIELSRKDVVKIRVVFSALLLVVIWCVWP